MDPLILLIEPELDERAATATMSRAQRVYEEGARDISRVMRQQLTQGTTAAGRGFEEMETRARRAYLSMQDAGDKVAAAERKLEAARERGSANTETLARRVERARLDEIQAITRATDAYNEYDRVTQRATGSMSRFATTAGAGIREALGEGIRGATAQFGPLGTAAETVIGGMSTRAAIAATGIGAIGLAAVASGKQLYDLGSTWDDITDNIAVRTGKLGADLDSIVGTVRELGSETAAPLEAIGDIAGRVSQSMGLAGNDLSNMTKSLADLNAMTGEQTDIRGLGKAFDLFGVSPQDQVAALDSLFNASQATGASVNELIGATRDAGKAAREFGMGFGETAGLLATLDEAGVDFTRAAPSLSIALKNLARDGREPADGLRDTITEIKNLADAGREAEAVTLAQATFGRGYVDFFNAIKSGKLDVDQLNSALEGTGPSIEETRKATADWSEEWQTLKNKMSGVFAPAAEFVFGQVNHQLDQAGQGMSGFGDLMTGIGQAWEELAALVSGNPLQVNVVTGAFTMGPDGKIVQTGQPAATVNPLDVFGGGAGGAGSPTSLDDALGLPPGTIGGGANIPAPRAGATGGSVGTGLPTGPVQQWNGQPAGRGGAAGGGTSLPEAPQLPLQYTNTAGLPTNIANAQTRLDEAAHEVAEKEARVNQLRSSNLADANDIQKAENDLAKSRQDQLQAEQALTDARIKSAEQANKQLGKLSNDLTELGNELDADFGLSKGLGGLIENAVKALGNALTAPFLAALGMVEKANPNEGSGLMGIMAANGAFGSQYTPGSIAATQVSGTSGGPQGYSAASAGSYGAPVGGGAPYGLPGSTNTGGYGSSGAVFPDWVHALEQQFGVKASTYSGHQTDNRSEAGYAPNPNGENRGIDWSGPVDAMQRFADYLSQVPGALEQVIWQNPSTGQATEIAGGQPQPGYFSGDLGGHQDHVHTRQSAAIPVPGGMSIPALSAPSPAYTGVSPGLPTVGAGGGGWFPGLGMPQSPVFGGGMPGIGSGIGQAGAPGVPQPGVGGAIGAGQGGAAYPSTGGNSGNVLGGMAMDGLMAATAGLDMMMPGAGAAAKIGIQLANRTVGYAAQNAGILASGALETLSLGDNPRGSLGASWLGKGLGGLAGAAAALPNIAGGKPPGPMEQAGGGQQGKAGNTYGDTNINVQAREGASGQEHGEQVAAETSRMYAPAGKQ